MRILIAHDGTPASDPIATNLQNAGLPAAGQAVVLCVAEDYLLPSGAMAPAEFGGIGVMSLASEPDTVVAKETAERAASHLATLLPGWKVRSLAARGNPSGAIIRQARHMAADLICVGSSAKTRFERWMLGSISREVLFEAGCSVRVVRPLPESRQTNQPPRILVGYDGSLDSDVVVHSVGARTWPPGTHVRLVTAVDEPILHSLPVTAAGPAMSQERIVRLRASLDHAARTLADLGLDVTTSIEQADPKELLLHEVTNWQADCIFVGSRGLGRVGRLLMGSVSTAIADKAPCTVEVVRSHLSQPLA